MTSNLPLPWNPPEVPAPGSSKQVSRQTARTLSHLRDQALLREALISIETAITTAKIRSAYSVGNMAMVEHSLHAHLRGVLAAADPFSDEELKFVSDTTRLGVGELVANHIIRRIRDM